MRDDVQQNPVKAIRAKCLDCCCGSSAEVKRCPCEDCALHPFRFGSNPYRAKREFTAEEKAELAMRLHAARNAPTTQTKKSVAFVGMNSYHLKR